MNPPHVSTNRAKYEARNPVVRRMIGGFFERLGAVVSPLGAGSVLDAGCGEGEALDRLGPLLPDRVVAIDVEQQCVDDVRARLPGVEVQRQSVLDLDFPDRSFDLVLCLEVLEHLPDPSLAVRELSRVSAHHVVVSVPYEPYFRLGSLLRGKHITALGNHPEHINHFNRRSLRSLLEPVMEVVELRVSFPWLIAVGAVRRRADHARGSVERADHERLPGPDARAPSLGRIVGGDAKY